MSDQPGCPCSICDADFADTERLQMNASVDLRTRIAAIVHEYSVPIPMAELVADAVIAVVSDEFIHSRGMFSQEDDDE